MKDHALPLSILVLAAAIALHGVQPARADIPPDPPTIPEVEPEPSDEGPLAPECRPIRLGTPKEYEKVMGELHATGRDEMVVVGSGLVCAWR